MCMYYSGTVYVTELAVSLAALISIQYDRPHNHTKSDNPLPSSRFLLQTTVQTRILRKAHRTPQNGWPRASMVKKTYFPFGTINQGSKFNGVIFTLVSRGYRESITTHDIFCGAQSLKFRSKTYISSHQVDS